jgi:hypothetical protein
MFIPYLPFEAIEDAAQQFLAEYHEEMTLPIPIEHIVECDLKLDVVPTPGLYRVALTDGWITSDLTTIFVDMDQFENSYNRYRFTLAHEVAHVVLHHDFYSEHQFESVAQWKAFTLNLDEGDRARLEFQANEFAGRVLVPTGPLTGMYTDSVDRIRKIVGAGIKLDKRVLAHYVALDLCESFEVSSQCMEIRILRQFLS